MALRITTGEVKGVSVVRLDGKIVFGKEAAALKEKISSLIASGKKNLILNMGQVTQVDSAGLSALVAANSAARSCGGSLQLCNLEGKTNQLLQITKLLNIFKICPTETEALQNF